MRRIAVWSRLRALLLSVVTTTLAAATPSHANEAFRLARAVVVEHVAAGATAPTSVDDPRWQKGASTSMPVSPQDTVALNDRTANAAMADRAPGLVRVRALRDDVTLAILVQWFDATEDRALPDATDAFGDAVALEVPQHSGAGVRLPYIGMGDDEQPVLVWMQRAAAEGPEATRRKTQRDGSYVAAGFGSLTRAPQAAMTMQQLRYDATAHEWRALFVRPRVMSSSAGGHAMQGALVPFAVAIWDGARAQRGGNKLLSSWLVLADDAVRTPDDARYEDELSWGYRPGDLGDAARGKPIVHSVCIACHRVGTEGFSPPGLAPDLGMIGAQATPSYLRDSLLSPSTVVVPGLNRNAHQDRTKAPDASGALPNNDAFVWFTVDEQGRKVSKMPAFDKMPEQQQKDIIAYLATLGMPASARGTP